MHRQERQLVSESFFLSQNRNLKSPISADWQLWFPLGWQSSGGNPDQEERVWERRRIRPLAGQTNHLPCTMLSAWRWPEMSVWGATVRVWCSDIICDPSCVVWQQSRMVLLPLESWTQVNRISQWVKDWWLTIMEKQMWNSRCCPRISHRNAHLMRNWARL